MIESDLDFYLRTRLYPVPDLQLGSIVHRTVTLVDIEKLNSGIDWDECYFSYQQLGIVVALYCSLISRRLFATIEECVPDDHGFLIITNIRIGIEQLFLIDEPLLVHFNPGSNYNFQFHIRLARKWNFQINDQEWWIK